MGQQISLEAALAAFREQYGKVADENVLLRAQASQLERRVKELEDAAQLPSAGGPDLAAQPPYPEDER
jgi:phage shock protein A